MAGLALNAKMYFPREQCELDYPDEDDPLFFDSVRYVEGLRQKIEKGQIQLSNYQEFVQILDQHKSSLVTYDRIFRKVNQERIEYRLWLVKLIFQIVKWRKQGDFYERADELLREVGISSITVQVKNEKQNPNEMPSFSGLSLLCNKLTRINYEIVQKARENLEIKLEAKESLLKEAQEKWLDSVKENQILERRLRSNENQMKELLLCDQQSK